MLHRQTFPVTATRCLFGIVATLWATLAVLVVAGRQPNTVRFPASSLKQASSGDNV